MNHSIGKFEDAGCLSLPQRIFYESNGFLVIPCLVSSNLLERCSQRFDDIISGKADRGKMTVMYDITDKKSVNKIQDINYDVVFQDYIKCPQVLDVVQSLIGQNILAVHSMLISKPPDVGSNSSRHPPHQDLYYFPFRPENKIVAAWTAIEPCDTFNGCLYVWPGSHKLNLYPHNYPQDSDPVNKFYHGINNLPREIHWINLPMEPGDTVFFHPLLVHGSGVNKSTRTRKAISCHYAAADCRYINISGTVQERIEKELLKLLRKRYPDVEMAYEDIWRFKALLVRGIRSSL